MEGLSWDRRCILLTNHALVLGVIEAEPGVRIREIAERVEITERAVESLLADLIQVGFLTRRRVGRRNVYEVHRDQKLRHPLIGDRDVGGLLRAIVPGRPKAQRTTPGTTPATADVPRLGADDLTTPSTTLHLAATSSTSTRQGLPMKRVLVWTLVLTLFLLASAAYAATRAQHRAPSPTHTHHTATAHPSALVAPSALIAPGASAGPETLIGVPTGSRHPGGATIRGAASGTAGAATTSTRASAGTSRTRASLPPVGVGVTAGGTGVGVTVGVGTTGVGVHGAGGNAGASVGAGGGGISVGVGTGGPTVTARLGL